jgi:Icc-related predicted phosphoesterase
MKCLFTSDLHGDPGRYRTLFRIIEKGDHDGVFLGGDLSPLALDAEPFLKKYFFSPLRVIRCNGGSVRLFTIMGNDDPVKYENLFLTADSEGLLDYVRERTVGFGKLHVTGYPFIPPSPFLLKDWEKYDVSRHIEPGDVPPEEGRFTFDVDRHVLIDSTISKDLNRLSGNSPPSKTIYLFHAPPYGGNLDKADLEGAMFDHAPIDPHVGSIAILRFIEERQPMLTLHGHVHESSRLTKHWRERIGKTYCFSGATDRNGLAAVRFDTDDLEGATRSIIPI